MLAKEIRSRKLFLFLNKRNDLWQKKLSNGIIIHVITDPLKRRIVYTTV